MRRLIIKVNNNNSMCLFYSLTNRAERKFSPVGEEIYEWDYVDEDTGELKHDKTNVREEVQSHVHEVDYKSKINQILKGEDNNARSGIYLDTRKFNGDFADINEYIGELARAIKEQVYTNDVVSKEQKVEQATPQVGQNSDNGGQNQQNGGDAK